MSPSEHHDEELAADIEKIEREYERAKEEEHRAELAIALGDLYFGADLEESRKWYETATSHRPGDPESQAGLAEIAFESWSFAEAEQLAREALSFDSEAARAHFVLAMCAERKQDDRESQRHYRIAAQQDPQRFPQPARLSRDEFEAVVQEALGLLPPPVQELMSDVAVVVDDVPAEELREGPDSDHLGPSLLGLFEGTPPLDLPHDALPELPPRITLFQRNIERIVENRDDLREEIARTVLHEVGHLVGMSEEDLEAAGFD